MERSPLERILKEQTKLSGSRIQFLLRIYDYLGFCESLSAQEVTLFVRDEETIFLIGALSAYFKETKNQSIIGYNVDTEIKVVSLQEVPLLWEIVETAKPIEGHMEFDYSHKGFLFGYPLIDNSGKCIGGLAFTSHGNHRESQDALRVVSETLHDAIVAIDTSMSSAYQDVSITDGVIIINGNGTIIYANPMAHRLVEIIGVNTKLVGSSIYGGTVKLSRAKKALEEGKGSRDDVIYGEISWEQILLPVITGQLGKRLIVILKDRTKLREKDRQLLIKNSLIKEIHHRVKNNLQTVSALLRMQSRESSDVEVKHVLQDSIHRIESMALVHEVVSNYDEEYIGIQTIVEELYRLLHQSLSKENSTVQFTYRGENILLSSHKGSYMSLVFNELLSNIYKHAFGNLNHISVTVSVSEDEEYIFVTIEDTGIGIPRDFSVRNNSNLGLRIVRTLVENELHGTIHWERQDETGAGTKVFIKMRKDESCA